MEELNEIKKLKIRISKYQSYLKTRVIRYWSDDGFQETPYNEMDYHYRINDLGYNKIICKMDRTAFELSKLQELLNC